MDYKHPGDRFSIRAADWNAIADVVHRVNSLGALPGDAGANERPSTVWAVNDDAAVTFEFGDVVAVGGLYSGSTIAEKAELRGFSCTRLISSLTGTVGIVTERIEPGKTGRIIIHGYAVARVTIGSFDDSFWGCAEPDADSQTLQLRQTGRVVVETVLDGGEGEYPRQGWALVHLGAQGQAVGVARIVNESGLRTLRWVDKNYSTKPDVRIPYHDPGGFLTNARDGDLAAIALERRTNDECSYVVLGAQDRAGYGIAYADADMEVNHEVPLRDVVLFGPRNGYDELPTTAYCLGPAAQQDDLLLLFRDTIQRSGAWICLVVPGANTSQPTEFAWAAANDKPIGGNGPGPLQVEATINGQVATVYVPACSSRHTAIFAGTLIYVVKRSDGGWDAVGGDLYDDPIGTIRMTNNANNVPQGWQVIANVTDRYLRVGNVAGNVGGVGAITPTHNAGMYAPQSHTVTMQNHEGFLLRLQSDENAPEREYILDAGGSSSHSLDSQNTDLTHPTLDYQAITHAEMQVEPPFFTVVLIQRVE